MLPTLSRNQVSFRTFIHVSAAARNSIRSIMAFMPCWSNIATGQWNLREEQNEKTLPTCVRRRIVVRPGLGADHGRAAQRRQEPRSRARPQHGVRAPEL